MPAVEFSYRPLPIHEPFHVSQSRERALAGAMGSGKSYALCAEAIAWCLEQPGIRGMISRKTVPALRDTTEAVFFDILPTELYRAGSVRRSGGHVAEFIFPNGSTVLFKSIDDLNKLKSINLGFVAFDEANEFTEEEWLFMSGLRLRQRDLTAEALARGYTGEITRRGAWLAFNPEGHDWIYKRFVDRSSDSYKAGSEWFRSTSFDNPYLPLDYIDSLMAMPEAWIKRYVLCQFDDFAGQIYEGWNWDEHVIEPFTKGYPDGAAFWMGMDPGTRNPTAGLWVVVDPAQRRLIGVAEYEQTRLDAISHANAWRLIEAQKKLNVNLRIADPSIATPDRGSNMRLEDQYRRLGYTFQYGPRTHDIRIPALGQLIAQGRFVVTKECPRTFEEIREYRWEDLTPAQRQKGVDPRETPLKKDDHLVDCAQYLASRWVRPNKIAMDKARTFASPQHELAFDVSQTIRRQNQRHAKRRRMTRGHDLGSVPL